MYCLAVKFNEHNDRSNDTNKKSLVEMCLVMTTSKYIAPSSCQDQHWGCFLYKEMFLSDSIPKTVP